MILCLKYSIGLGENDISIYDFYYNFRQFSDVEAVTALEEKLEPYLKHHEYTCLHGKPLDKKLIDFDEKCEENQRKYYQTFPLNPRVCERIFITPDDRTNFSTLETREMMK